MENKHTPGPWYAESGHEQRNGQLYWQVTDGNDAIMQNQFCWCQGSQEANARLIAAAPDLLEASLRAAEMLRVVSAFLRDQQPDGVARYDEADCDFCCIADDCDASAEDIEDAIAKARGQ